MEENRRIKAEINGIAHLEKKRKLQDEISEMPLPKKVQCNVIGGGDESEPESANSNSFYFKLDSAMFTDDEDAKTDLQYPETCYSDFPTTFSTSAATSIDFSLYSSESRSSTYSSSSEPESLSINGQPDCSNPDFSFSEYEKGCIDQKSLDMEIQNLLYPDGVAPSSSNFILSSGRWSVNHDAKQESKKLTIDKEFEQYFSMLML